MKKPKPIKPQATEKAVEQEDDLELPSNSSRTAVRLREPGVKK